MNFSLSRRIIFIMKSVRKFIALMLILWTPLFFSGAAYAATQMELANATSHQIAQPPDACHHMDSKKSTGHHDTQHHVGVSNCQHCGFCISFAAPVHESTTHVTSQNSPLASFAIWASSTHHITPENRPPIDA